MGRRINIVKLWLKQHGGNEQRLADAIDAFFDDQLRRVLSALLDVSEPTAENVPQLLHVDDENTAFMETVRPHLVASMGMGANTQLELFDARKAFDASELREFTLPQRVIDAIEANWSELEGQPFWRDIQSTTKTRITGIIDEGIQLGLGRRAMASLIRDRLGGDVSRSRANAIARTETTGAMNSGHQAGYDELARDGLIIGKTWESVGDSDVRLSHVAVNGQQVKPKDDFQVPVPLRGGGRRRRRRRKPRGRQIAGVEFAPFPGWWGLSPANRVSCRCTTLSVLPNGTSNVES